MNIETLREYDTDDLGCVCSVYTYGWVDKHEFVLALLKEFEGDFDMHPFLEPYYNTENGNILRKAIKKIRKKVRHGYHTIIPGVGLEGEKIRQIKFKIKPSDLFESYPVTEWSIDI